MKTGDRACVHRCSIGDGVRSAPHFEVELRCKPRTAALVSRRSSHTAPSQQVLSMEAFLLSASAAARRKVRL